MLDRICGRELLVAHLTSGFSPKINLWAEQEVSDSQVVRRWSGEVLRECVRNPTVEMFECAFRAECWN